MAVKPWASGHCRARSNGMGLSWPGDVPADRQYFAVGNEWDEQYIVVEVTCRRVGKWRVSSGFVGSLSALCTGRRSFYIPESGNAVSITDQSIAMTDLQLAPLRYRRGSKHLERARR